MKIFASGKNLLLRLVQTPSASRRGALALVKSPRPSSPVSGNVFFALFAGLAMVGAVGFGFNSVLRGPISSMTEATRRTVAESTVMTSSRMAIVGATTQQANGGDCDGDGVIEPMPYRDAGTAPHPVGGGYLPTGLIPDSIDPWKDEYGYCVWDSGSISVSNNNAGCGGSTAKRLQGSPLTNQYSIAIISAGKDKNFQTTCNAYVDANADSAPDTPLIVKTPGSDDIVLGYTYAEANGLGNGLWKVKTASTTTVQTGKSLEVTGNAKFSDKVVLTAGGLVLPGDPGNDSLTGPCNSANDKQLRRNTSTVPPKIEICDFSNGLGWNAVSGTTSSGSGTGNLVGQWKLDETTGNIAADSVKGNNGTFLVTPTWDPGNGALGGALVLPNNDYERVLVNRTTDLEPTAITFSIWIKRNGDQAQYASVLNKTGSSIQTVFVQFSDSPGTKLQYVTNSSSVLTCTSCFIPDKTWTQVVGVYDPNGPAPQKRFYINGVRQASFTTTTPLNYDKTTSGNWIFGAATVGGYGNRFKGSIDDVRIYNYGMTDAQVASLYTASTPYFRIQRPSRVGTLYSWGTNTTSQLNNAIATDSAAPLPMLQGKGFVQTSSGKGFGCAVKSDGTVWCWGDDTNGVLGNGPTLTTAQNPATKVVGLTDAAKVETSQSHACALKVDGTVWCWGDNQYGAFGNSTSGTTSSVPVQANIGNITDISVGVGDTCAVKNDGTAWCWGRGVNGQLGNGANASSTVPVQVSNVTDFVSIHSAKTYVTLAYLYNCGTTKRGSVYCWGLGQNGNLGDGTVNATSNVPTLVSTYSDFSQVQVNSSSCGLRANGQIACWGPDANGELGNGSTTGSQSTPSTVVNIYDFKKVTTGVNFACGIRQNDDAYCWGTDAALELGNGTTLTANQISPSLVAGANFIDISGGYQMVSAIVDESPIGMTAKLSSQEAKISVGRTASCAIVRDGTAWCWGSDAYAQLGNGSTQTADAVSPSLVTDPGPWMQISQGYLSTCAIKSDGTLWCWGDNTSGQLGKSSATQHSPSQVPDLGPWSKVSMGYQHACGIKTDGKLYCWGSDTNGRLGNGTGTGTTSTPTIVTETGPWTDVSAGTDSTCAVKMDGSIWCWGADANGQLGNGSVVTADQQSPYLVVDSSLWSKVAVGQAHACAVKQDGTAWCWGANGVGDLGTGAITANQSSPTRVWTQDANSSPWVSIANTNTTSCGLKADGSAWCWGYGASGQLGNNANPGAQRTPVRVMGANDWVAIGAGGPHTCGIKLDGSIWCWGDDASGNLGNGPAATATKNTPQRVLFPFNNPAFIWNDTLTAAAPPIGVNAVIGQSGWISDDGTAKGLNLGAAGRSSILQTTTPNQFMVEAANANGSAQISLKAASAKVATDVTSGLVAKWLLDEASGVSAQNAFASGTGALTGSPTWNPTGGKVGGSLGFPSGVRYVTVNRNSVLEPTSFTLSFWAKPTIGAAVADYSLVSKTYSNNTTSTPSYAVTQKDSAGRISFKTGHASGVDILSTNTAIPFGVWSYITVSYDASAASQQKKIYINGVLENAKTQTAAIAYDSTSTGNLFFGQTGSASNAGRYEGELDDIRLYNRALTDAEVAQVYYFTGQDPVTYSMGQDYLTSSLLIGRNTTAVDKFLGDIKADFAIDPAGNVGVGGVREPASKLDVRGAVKISDDSGTCTSTTREGTIKYSGGATPWQYCNGSGWQPLISIPDVLWDGGGRSLSSGNYHTCAMKVDGTLWCWGDNGNGQLGNGVNTPSSIPVPVLTDTGSSGWSDWTTGTAGESKYSCGIRANGTAWCWGDNSGNALGNGSTTSSNKPVQVQTDTGPGGWSDWTSIASYGAANCGLRSNGTLWCWGVGGFGQLGNGSTANKSRPTQVQTSTGPGAWSDWTSIAGGGFVHTCGMRSGGTIWCWGYNGNGELGQGDTTNQSRPVQVQTDTGPGGWSDWTFLMIGVNHGCGIRANGTAWCWGYGANGQLGNGIGGNQARPVQVQTDTGPGGWSDWITLTGGAAHTCGIRANGTAWCWGSNGSGQLGTGGTTANFTRPLQVKNEAGSSVWSDWVSIIAGNGYTCGTRANGTLWCWGYGANGALGDGQSASNRTLPVQVR